MERPLEYRRGDDQAYSGLMLAARITLPHFSVTAGPRSATPPANQTDYYRPESSIGRAKIAWHLNAMPTRCPRSQSVRQTPLQWEIVAHVKALNVVAIEAFVTYLHPGTQRAHGCKLLDSEPDRLRCGRKAAIAQRLSCSALALRHE